MVIFIIQKIELWSNLIIKMFGFVIDETGCLWSCGNQKNTTTFEKVSDRNYIQVSGGNHYVMAIDEERCIC